MTLRGPVDADRFRTTYYGARYYIDPLDPDGSILQAARDKKEDRLPAFTTVARVLGGTFRKRHGDQTYDLDPLRCAKYVAANRDKIIGLDDESLIHLVAGAASRDLRQAANRGTGVHAILEAFGKGQVVDKKWVECFHPASVEYFDVCEALWAEQSPKVGYAEVVGLNWEVGYGCTSDGLAVSLASLPGEQLAIDYKTRGPDSSHKCYEKEAMQLAAAAFAEYLFVEEDGEVKRIKPPKLDRGVIVSIKPDSYELYSVDLDVAWEGWQETAHAWRTLKEAKSLGRKAAGKAIFVHNVSAAVEAVKEAFPGAEAFDIEPTPSTEDEVTQKREWLQGRIDGLDADAKRDLISRWPVDVPTLKKFADHTAEQLEQIAIAISATERAVGAPFPEPDPTEQPVPGDDPRVVSLSERVKAMDKKLQKEVQVRFRSSLLPSFTKGEGKETQLAIAEQIVTSLEQAQ